MIKNSNNNKIFSNLLKFDFDAVDSDLTLASIENLCLI